MQNKRRALIHLNSVKIKINHLSTICILNKVAGLLLNSFLCHLIPPWIPIWNVILTATRVCKSCLNAALECTVSAFWEFVEHIFVFITEPWLKTRVLPWTPHTDLQIHSMCERERGRDETLMISVAAPPHKNSKLGGYTSCRCFAVFFQHVSLGRVSSTVRVLLFYAAPVFPGTKLPAGNYLWHAAEPLSRWPCCQVRIPAWKRGVTQPITPTGGNLWA